MQKNKLENLMWICFISLGIILVIGGLILYFVIFNYENKVDTIGKISKVALYRDMNDNQKYEVYVLYSVDGEQHESKLNGYSSQFYEGKEIKMYYDKDNPDKIGMKSLDLLFLIIPGIGIIFLIIGGIGIIVNVKKKRLESLIKKII